MKSERVEMKVSFDRESDAAYIYLKQDIGAGGVVESVPLAPAAGYGMINLDFDDEGRLVGIEVLGARNRLPKGILRELEPNG